MFYNYLCVKNYVAASFVIGTSPTTSKSRMNSGVIAIYANKDIENIQSKVIIKDYKQNGYYIDVVYKDDPDWTYSYHFLGRDLRDIFSYKSIHCLIFNSESESYDLVGGEDVVKYPPINQ